MKRKIPILIGFCGLIVVANARVSGQAKVDVDDPVSFNSITKTEIEMLLADIAKTNPAILERLVKDPEVKKQQIENLKQLLAFASQALRDGLASGPTNRQELDNIRAEILAVNYDREINKDKLPAFGFITRDQVAAYWRGDGKG